jgi:hypothetical protein
MNIPLTVSEWLITFLLIGYAIGGAFIAVLFYALVNLNAKITKGKQEREKCINQPIPLSDDITLSIVDNETSKISLFKFDSTTNTLKEIKER